MAYPKVFFSLTERLEPRVVQNADDEALLNPRQWTTIPPQPKIAPENYPKLYANPNVWPVIVHNPGELAALGGDWRQFDLTPFLPPTTAVRLEPLSATIPAIGSFGETFSVFITTPGQDPTWMPEKDASATWLTILSPTVPQTADGSVTYQVAPNAGAARSANIYVNGKTFPIDQEAGA